MTAATKKADARGKRAPAKSRPGKRTAAVTVAKRTPPVKLELIALAIRDGKLFARCRRIDEFFVWSPRIPLERPPLGRVTDGPLRSISHAASGFRVGPDVTTIREARIIVQRLRALPVRWAGTIKQITADIRGLSEEQKASVYAPIHRLATPAVWS